MNKVSVYIVEDEPIIADALELAITESGYDCVGKSDNAEEALIAIKALKPDIALLDITIYGDKDGIDLAHELNASTRTPFIFVTSYSSDKYLERVRETNPMGFISKPFNEADIKANIMISMTNHVLSDSVAEDDDQLTLTYEQEVIDFLKEEIIKNAEGTEIGAKKLADMTNMSESTLQRFLRMALDVSPDIFVRENKLEYAMELLKRKRVSSLSELADRVGFQNIHYFSQLFKNKMDTTSTLDEEQQFFKKVEAACLTRISDPKFSIPELATLLDVSQSLLFKRIKNASGLSPLQLMTELRLQLARELLLKEEASSVSEIMVAVGIQKSDYFAKLYKNRFGKLPSEEL